MPYLRVVTNPYLFTYDPRARTLFAGTPRGIDITSVRNSFLKLPGVKDVHDLRLWSLSMDKIALSVHLAVG